MKKYLSVLLILSALCSINPPSLSQDCTYSWSQQNSGTTRSLYTCKAVSELVCWVAGANATVLRTTDGGTNWLNANPNPGIITGDIRNMEALNETTALVTTESQTSTAVYKTTDGGDSWFQVYANTEGFIKGIRLLDPQDGIAIGNPVSTFWNVLVTGDGGNTWESPLNRPSANKIHQAVHNSFQVSLPYIYWGTSFNTIFHSTNGGITYNEYETPGAGAYIFSLFINADSIGFAAGVAMSRSEDGGITFLQHSVPGWGNINGIQGSGNNFWYTRGEKIFHSTDDGISWIDEYTTPATLTLNHMDFPDNINECQMGWAVGYGGTIHKLTSGSVTSGDYQSEMPMVYELRQNYPNPFNPTTNIELRIADFGYVSLKVYDVLGKEVATLVNEEKMAGIYEISFDASELPSGIYFYKLTAGNYSETKKMTLLR